MDLDISSWLDAADEVGGESDGYAIGCRRFQDAGERDRGRPPAVHPGDRLVVRIGVGQPTALTQLGDFARLTDGSHAETIRAGNRLLDGSADVGVHPHISFLVPALQGPDLAFPAAPRRRPHHAHGRAAPDLTVVLGDSWATQLRHR